MPTASAISDGRQRYGTAALSDSVSTRPMAPCTAPRMATAATPSASQTSRRPSDEAPLARRPLLLDESHERPDPSDLGLRSCRNDDGSSGSGDRSRALVEQVEPLGQRRAVLELDVGALRNRERLTCQCRFGDAKVGRRDEPRVCRHAMSRTDVDDVARHERLRVDEAQMALADYGRARHVEIEQGFHGPPRAPFGEEADERVDDEDGRNRGRLESISKDQRDDGRRQKEKDDHSRQLVAQDGERGNGLRRRQAVRAIPLEPRCSLGIG
jgi:hypothetical protein